jgi:hypothetical protein
VKITSPALLSCWTICRLSSGGADAGRAGWLMSATALTAGRGALPAAIANGHQLRDSFIQRTQNPVDRRES